MMWLGVMLMAAAVAQGEAKADPAAQAAPAAAVAAGEKPAKPKKLCVEEERLGSHFRQRICATPEEWKRRREQDAELMSAGAGNTPSK